MKTQLTKKIDQYLFREFNIVMSLAKKWTIEQILKEVYEHGFEAGRKDKMNEIKTVLNMQ